MFPCLPGQKAPATRHGYKDATTDPDQITEWFTRRPDYNLAIATGAPGPDVLDVDVHGAAGNGYAALGRLHCAGLLDGCRTATSAPPAAACTSTSPAPTSTAATWPRHHVDFRSAGGYVLAPPSQVDGHPYLPSGDPAPATAP